MIDKNTVSRDHPVSQVFKAQVYVCEQTQDLSTGFNRFNLIPKYVIAPLQQTFTRSGNHGRLTTIEGEELAMQQNRQLPNALRY